MRDTVVLLDGQANHPREILGNKGHGIDTMRRHNFPVPPAFCITTEVGARYLVEPTSTIDAIWNDVLDRMSWLEAETSRTFGRGPCPLLVSVRSGATRSMPGMMDTILDLGINDAVEQALTALNGPEFAHDTRRRFIDMYRRIVTGDPNHGVPNDPYAQLRTSIETVFASWNSPRALAYRAHYGHDDQDGTAVVVQAMVFGNQATNSGAGVLFSRNPITGANEPFGEWLPGGQGDDVVSGLVDVEPITALRTEQPAVYAELTDAARRLERLASDIQEIEFTTEDGKLWLLQTRAAERSAQAAVRLALQLRREGFIDDAEAMFRVTPAHIETLLLPALQPETRLAATLLAKGLSACPGIAIGMAYTDVDNALDAADRGEQVILVRDHTKPEDVPGMLAAQGIVTGVGGTTSHAAVVSRELGRVAVVSCGHGVTAALAGRQITVDGYEGEVRDGNLPLSAWSETDTPELREVTEIARRLSPLRAHTTGDYPRLDDHSEATVKAALTAGHSDVVSATPLITMLTALRLGSQNHAMSELVVLQAIRLKGRVSPTDLAMTLNQDLADVTKTVEQLTASGLLVEGTTLRISPSGRDRLRALLAEERTGTDSAALAVAYKQFRSVNADFKALITDWQLNGGRPNTHDDAQYDAAILTRLDTMHQRMTPIIAATTTQLPRLSAYLEKLRTALNNVKDGEIAWLTQPLIDSYHTVWFELHEELIQALGLTREEVAKSGDAQ